MKKAVSLLSVFMALIMCLFGNATAVSASENAPDDTVTPYYDYTQYVTSNLNITSSGRATVTIHCSGVSSSVKKIKAETCIQRKVGIIWVKTDIGTSDDYWYDTSNSVVLNASHSVQLSKSATYRAKTVFTVYTSSDSEKITMYSGTDSY